MVALVYGLPLGGMCLRQLRATLNVSEEEGDRARRRVKHKRSQRLKTLKRSSRCARTPAVIFSASAKVNAANQSTCYSGGQAARQSCAAVQGDDFMRGRGLWDMQVACHMRKV